MGRPKNSKNGIHTVRNKNCIQCNTTFTPSYANYHKVKFCSMACSFKAGRKSGRLGKKGSEKQKEIMRSRVGSKHPKWKGGISLISKKIRVMGEYKKWRSNCFKRDNWTCQTCHFRGYVTVHHINSLIKIVKSNSIKTMEEARNCKELWDENNGVTLCEECHKLTDNYKGRARRLTIL